MDRRELLIALGLGGLLALPLGCAPKSDGTGDAEEDAVMPSEPENAGDEGGDEEGESGPEGNE